MKELSCRASILLERIFFMQQEKDYEPEGFAPSSQIIRPFTNDFIFMNVMRNPKICREILKMILPNEEIGAIRIKKSENPFVDNSEIEEDAGENMCQSSTVNDFFGQNDALEALNMETQKTLKLEAAAHGVRFDAFVESSKLWADIEMQPGKKPLGKRARYYQANIDLDFLEHGHSYEELKPSYIIFICTYDPFDRDEAVYFFRSWDVEKGLPIEDLSYKIILNTACSPKKVPEKLSAFYEYLNDPEKSQASELTRMIDARVRKFNSGEWRKKYMTFEQMLNERGRESFAQGHAEGRSEGEAIGAAQKQREIAKNLKKLGVGADEIVKATGLSVEDVEKL